MEVGPAWEKEILDKSFIRWEIEKSEQLVKCESFFGEFEINFEVITVFLLLKRYFELKIKSLIVDGIMNLAIDSVHLLWTYN